MIVANWASEKNVSLENCCEQYPVSNVTNACVHKRLVHTYTDGENRLSYFTSFSLPQYIVYWFKLCVWSIFLGRELHCFVSSRLKSDWPRYVCVSEAHLCLHRNAFSTFSGCVVRLLYSCMHKMCAFCKDSHTSIKYYPSRNQNGFETACFMDMMYTIVIRCWSFND